MHVVYATGRFKRGFSWRTSFKEKNWKSRNKRGEKSERGKLERDSPPHFKFYYLMLKTSKTPA